MCVRFIDEENTTSTNSFCELPLLNGQPKMSVYFSHSSKVICLHRLLTLCNPFVHFSFLSIHSSINNVCCY